MPLQNHSCPPLCRQPYGATSRYQARVDEWNARNGARFASAASTAETPNFVRVEGTATTLARWDARADGSYAEAEVGNAENALSTSTSRAFLPMSVMPGMERVAYPYCTGSTWRGGRHRLHGKKLPANFLGVITTENVTDAGNGLVDQAWNPLDEYIYDVSNGWMDQKCQCSWEWEYQSEPIPPTCPRVWFPWSGWVDDGWFVGNNVYFADDARYAVDAARSLSGGGWRVSGGWWVQDFGAHLPIAALGDLSGKTAIDLCAAPGGKTLQLARAGAEVTAVDNSGPRLERLSENLARTGLRAAVKKIDVLKYSHKPVDLVVLDAPCSASGTFRKNPEAPWLRSPVTLLEHASVQARMLDHALGLVKPGGTLLFIVCSLEPEEGEAQVDDFLRRQPNVALEPFDAEAVSGLPDALTPAGTLRILPSYYAHNGGVDGFFAARFRVGSVPEQS